LAGQQQQQQLANGTHDVEMLGADNAGEVVHTRMAGSKSSKKRQEPEPDGPGTAAGVAGEAAVEPGAENEDEAELDEELAAEQTLGDRVAQLEQQQQNMQQQQQGLQQQQQQQQHQEHVSYQQEAAAAAAPPSGPLKADSLAVLLAQALRSSDKALLERCLAVTNERVVNNTVKRLLPLDAALLLRAGVERLQSRPSRGQQLAVWLQAVLLHHTAYLMSAPGAAPVMSCLFQIIEARLAMQRQLLSLAGRLDLLLAQPGAQRHQAAQEDAETAANAAAAPQVCT
jgi:U3 small nucleolar RNA-associated protein 5